MGIRNAHLMLITGILLLLTVEGCSKSTEDQLRDSTDQIFQVLKDGNFDEVKEFIDNVENDSESENTDTDTLDNLTGGSDIVVDFFTENYDLISYEIETVDPEALTVTVSVTYPDATEVIGNYIGNNFFAFLASALAGEEQSDDEIAEHFQEAIESSGELDTKTNEMTFTFENQSGEYVISQIPEEFYDVLSIGIYDWANSWDLSSDDETDTAASQVESSYFMIPSGVWITVIILIYCQQNRTCMVITKSILMNS